MNNLDTLIGNYLQSDKFESEIKSVASGSSFNVKSHTVKSNGNSKNYTGAKISNKQLVGKAKEKLESYLREEIASMKVDVTSRFSGRSNIRNILLSAIVVETSYIENVGYSITINFNEEMVKRPSWYEKGYPNGAFLPTLFNNGYNAKNYVYKGGRRSKKTRQGYNFMKNAVNKFNAEFMKDNIRAEYNEIYTDGTLPRGNKANDIF